MMRDGEHYTLTQTDLDTRAGKHPLFFIALKPEPMQDTQEGRRKPPERPEQPQTIENTATAGKAHREPENGPDTVQHNHRSRPHIFQPRRMHQRHRTTTRTAGRTGRQQDAAQHHTEGPKQAPQRPEARQAIQKHTSGRKQPQKASTRPQTGRYQKPPGTRHLHKAP